ncbi:MAG: CCA tRNA nucleotidyltransferase, partial [Roseibium sp.]|uniref:CCA tRNA nucleotidyltransferase n=1 Tax=Roseibium sp. TaxID=1936156 RepID=UPI00329801DF
YDHGTSTLMAGGEPYEVTTFRRDVETDGRRAVVAYSTDMFEDAARRDFTMNALYADADGHIHDPLGGLPDLEARHLRFIGKAEDRIAEDHLRILRFFRFNAIYGRHDGDIDPKGLFACANRREGLSKISAERIGAEMRKILGAENPSRTVELMAVTGVLEQILPGANPFSMTALMRHEASAGLKPDPMRRLASLGLDDVTDALRLSRVEAKQLRQFRDALDGDELAGEVGYRYGAEAKSILALRAAVNGSILEPDAIMAAGRGAEQRFPVTARDLIPEYSGSELGARLKEIEAEWIASDFSLTKDDLLYAEDDEPGMM